ncbi:MAG TPA: GNAT family N-acetyltransferase [Gemmatimonadaceae bacterium]|nr:GNAT family N-acetyltransferase [Gemmatimonadaceae bacterium]
MIPRPATLTDVTELVRVINLAYVVEAEMFHGTRTTDADVRARLAVPNARFFVIPADAPGALAGSVYVEIEGDQGYFGMLAVDPAAQGRGFGRALVRGAEAYARDAGCATMNLDVVDLRGELTTFYGSLGYQAIGESAYPRPEQTKLPVRLIHMTKQL